MYMYTRATMRTPCATLPMTKQRLPVEITGGPKPVAKLEGLTQLWRAHRSKPNMTNCSCVNVTTS